MSESSIRFSIITCSDTRGIRQDSAGAALESMIGGRLTQKNLLAMASGSGVVWNDYRHFEADVSVATRNEIRRDTLEIIESVVRK